MPTAGQEFDILSWASVSGEFLPPQLPPLDDGVIWNTDLLYTQGVLQVQLSGDHNNDGTVDAADYVIWRKTDGSPGGYNTWRTNFGRTAGGGSVSNTTVPELAAALLLVMGTAIACWRTSPTGLARSKTR